MKRATSSFLAFLLMIALIVSCTPFPDKETEEKCKAGRHYETDYNFILASDSLVLQEERPMHLLVMPEHTDSMVIRKGELLVVAQIEIIPEDSIDSVWIKVARDQMTQGWTHESQLLNAAVPDDPISQGIRLFSRFHKQVTITLCLLAILTLLICRIQKRKFHLVHIRDIASPYPMLLCLSFGLATVLYMSIRLFVPELWIHFYFHPTLNPFGQPVSLAVFLSLAWLILILFIASIDDICHSLSANEAVLYILSLTAVLAGIHLFFTFTTLHFVGYFLWIAYAIASIVRYLICHRARFRCSHCGALLHNSGQCFYCNENTTPKGE